MSKPRAPSNFSWVSDSVAGFAFPYTREEAEYLVSVEIKHVITMCEEVPDDVVENTALIHHHLPVDDLTAADLPVIKKAIEIIKTAEENNEKVGVHCQLGQGRAGTILACYLAYKHGLSGNEAIRQLRSTRPNSVIFEQESAVRKYATYLKSS